MSSLSGLNPSANAFIPKFTLPKIAEQKSNSNDDPGFWDLDYQETIPAHVEFEAQDISDYEEQYVEERDAEQYVDPFLQSPLPPPFPVARMALQVELNDNLRKLCFHSSYSVSQNEFYATWNLGMPFFLRVVKNVEQHPGCQLNYYYGYSALTEENPVYDGTIAYLKAKNDPFLNRNMVLKQSSEKCMQKYRNIYSRFLFAFEKIQENNFSTSEFLVLARSIPGKGRIVPTKSGITFLKVSRIFTEGLTKALPTDIPYYNWQQMYNPSTQFEQLGSHIIVRVPGDRPNKNFYKKAVTENQVAHFDVVGISDRSYPELGINREITLDVQSVDLEEIRKNMGLSRYVTDQGFGITLVRA